MRVRAGIGYDVHPFAEGRTLMLGGIAIPGATGLAGHSDADVVLHAITDGLLGAAALGDIGTHFSPSDPANAGRASADFARAAAAMVRERAWAVGNVDCTIVAERPRLAAHVAAMRASIAAILDIEVEAVSVKASTNNGLGAIGAGEGIAAHAIVLIERAD